MDINTFFASRPPSVDALLSIREEVQAILTEAEAGSQFASGANLAAIAGGALALIGGIGSGGIIPLVCGGISILGALSTAYYAHEEQTVTEATGTQAIKLLALLDGMEPRKLAKLWQMSPTTFPAFMTACTNAVQESADGSWVLSAIVGGESYTLAISQALPYRYCSAYDIPVEALKAKLKESSPQQLPDPIEVELGPETVSEAIEVEVPPPASVMPVIELPAAIPAVELPAVELPQGDSIDLISALIDSPVSYLIIGATGSGKGFAVSNAAAAAQNKGLYTYVVDPKNDPKESGYWKNCSRVYKGFPWDEDKSFRFMSPPEKDEWLTGWLSDYEKFVGAINAAPHLLIFDEWTAVIGHLDTNAQLKAAIINMVCDTASQGDSAGHYAWVLGHTCNLKDLGISGGRAASFKKLYIYSELKTDKNALIQALSTTYFGGKFEAMAVQSVAKMSPCGRAFYHGGVNGWFPMSALQNLSGYDRDKREFLTPPSDTPEVVAPEPDSIPTKVEPESSHPDFSLNEELAEQVQKRGLAIASQAQPVEEIVQEEYTGVATLSPEEQRCRDLVLDVALSILRRRKSATANEVYKSDRRLPKLLGGTSEVRKILDGLVGEGLLLEIGKGRYELRTS